MILFRLRLTPEAGEDFARAGDRMLEAAKAIPGSGFVDMRLYTADDGEQLAVIWWRDRETLELWRRDLRHRAVKKAGRERWFSSYDVEVAEVLSASSHVLGAQGGRTAIEEIAINAPPDELFEFLADIDTLSSWATKIPNDVQVRVQSDPHRRMIEFLLWLPNGQEQEVCAEVLPDSVVRVHKTQLPGESDVDFERRRASLRGDLRTLARLFSRGEEP